jgi:AcrR family transcriptional regulator
MDKVIGSPKEEVDFPIEVEVKEVPTMARAQAAATDDHEPDVPDWRERAISRSVKAARSRAEQHVQRFLDAAFELIDERGTAEFTIQDVVGRSKQSLRGFYQYFGSKDDLVIALFEETVREAGEDIRRTVDAESDPLGRLRAFTIRLYEWCDPDEALHKRGSRHPRAISEFSMHLTAHADRLTAALRPLSRLLRELIESAAQAGAIRVGDVRRAAAFVQQAVLYSWFANRLAPHQKLDAAQNWELCLYGLGGAPRRPSQEERRDE